MIHLHVPISYYASKCFFTLPFFYILQNKGNKLPLHYSKQYKEMKKLIA